MNRPGFRAPALPLEAIAAGLLGLSVVFFVMAMPPALIERFVVASGLPALINAAQPPLGATARLLLALVAGGGIGVAVWYGLGLFDPAPPRFAPQAAPTLRRADAHPDAPARRPLSAELDLGEPLELVTPVLDDATEVADVAPPPSWTLAPEPVAEAEIAPEPHDPHATSRAIPVPAPQTDTASLLSLIDRLEAGLARRGAAAGSNVTPLPRGAKALDGTLRDALAELQRMAGGR